MTEEEFWRRYFQSKLFNAHRASIRSSAAQHVVKDDPIFDKYLEKEDDGKYMLLVVHFLHVILSPVELEPRRVRPEVADLFVSLGATQEDHIEVISPWSFTFNPTFMHVRLETKKM